MAASRTKLPETDTDWIGKFRDKKEGWWRRIGPRGGAGGGGMGCQFEEEIGSKVKISIGSWVARKLV